MTLHLRVSSLPLAVICPASARPSTVPINGSHADARLGTAAHEAFRPLAETNRIPWDSLDTIAARHGCRATDLRSLCWSALDLWRQVSESFPGAIAEGEISAPIAGGAATLTGHQDLLSIGPSAARGGDWKTGRKDRDHSAQLRGYAALTLIRAPHIDESTHTALWVRSREIENYTMRRDDLEAWERDITNRVIDWDGTYYPGDHCQHCPRWHECEATRAQSRQAVAIVASRQIVGEVECEIERFSPNEIVELYERASVVVDYAKRVLAAIRAHAVKNRGVEADAKELVVDTTTKREIDPIRAFPVLEAFGFSDVEIARVVTVQGSKIDGIVSAKAPRGEKGAARKEMKRLLEEADAITMYETERVSVRRRDG